MSAAPNRRHPRSSSSHAGRWTPWHCSWWGNRINDSALSKLGQGLRRNRHLRVLVLERTDAAELTTASRAEAISLFYRQIKQARDLPIEELELAWTGTPETPRPPPALIERMRRNGSRITRILTAVWAEARRKRHLRGLASGTAYVTYGSDLCKLWCCVPRSVRAVSVPPV